jgi:hypothetical protein
MPNRNNRKIKLRKIEDIKRVKRKKRIEQRFKEAEPAIEIKTSLPYCQKIAILVSTVFVLSFITVLYPTHASKSDYSWRELSRISCTNYNLANSSDPYFLAYEARRNKLATTKSELHKQIVAIIKNTPMEKMVDYIATRPRPVAAFLVGIAMKESKFGKFSPKKDGVECYNYWGYRGKENTTDSGYSCFRDPYEAINIVGDRIERIVNQGAKHPDEMISWKCGSTCAGHSPESVSKWISDVAINYYKLNPVKQIVRK